MTTSTSTTFSPSRRRTTRSTPCVLGCCGPMLITSSLVSNIAPWCTVGVAIRSTVPAYCRDSGLGIWDSGFGLWDSPHANPAFRTRIPNPESRIPTAVSFEFRTRIPNPESRIPTSFSFDVRLFPRLAQLEPVDRVFHQQLARPFERIVLALREALPVFRHQDAPAIGVPGEVHPEHVPHLALEPVRRRPHIGHRRYRLLLADLHFDPHALAMPRGIQVVDDVEARVLAYRPVRRGDIGTEIERR